MNEQTKSNKNGTSWVGENTRAAYVTVIGESEDGLTGQPVYVALLKGTFSLDSLEFKTRGEKAEAPEPTKLTGDTLSRFLNIFSHKLGFLINSITKYFIRRPCS